MVTAEQQRKAKVLLDLHASPRLLVLPNVWDPIGARVLAAKGYPAVATASAAISSSLGFKDEERITRRTMLKVVRRISRAVDVPVTADMESGYAGSLDELEDTTHGLIDTGAVGMNIEDGLAGGGSLRSLPEQAERIAKVREAAAAHNLHLVINARIDTFLTKFGSDDEERIEETVKRAEEYAQAGADCIYPIGPGDVETLTLLRSRISSPLNALATPEAAPLQTMAAIGINRVSFGPFLFRSCLRKFADIVDALARFEGYECFGREMFSKDEAALYLTSELEDN
jgi:2-methylisocitrate lyase-like PEP mutase family enzyme